MSKLSSNGARVDEALLGRVVAATQAGLAEFFAGIAVAPVAIEDKAQALPVESGLIGVISCVGDLDCSLTVLLPDATAPALLKAWIGFEIPPDGPDVGDAVGELINVLAGQILARFEEIGLKSQMSLPSVARGHDLKVLVPRQRPFRQLLLTTPLGHLWFEVSIEES